MAKFTHDDVMDAALNVIKNNCTKVTVCEGQPTTYTEGNATFALADVTVDSSDFTLANGTSGRKATFAAQTGVTVDVEGEGNHLAFLDVANSKLLHVTTITSPQTVYVGNTINLGAEDIQIGDPT
jgi:hypothetical protein